MKKRRAIQKPRRKRLRRALSKRRFFILYGGLLLIIAGLLYWFYSLFLVTQPPFGIPTPFEESSPLPTTAPSSHGALPLTTTEYKAIRADLYTLVDTQTPKVALEKLNSLISTNPSILRSCHAFVHDIGHRAFDKYNDVGIAFTYQDELCGAGYLHGVIEAYFRDTPNALVSISSLCNSYGLESPAQRCYHGIGHGLMFYSQNDLPFAAKECTALSGKPRIRCLEGVYMENFNTDQKTHPSIYLDPSNPFYPCGSQPAGNQGVCYFYAPLYYLALHPDEYSKAFEWCTTAPRAYVGTCTTGLSTRIMKEHIAQPAFVEKLCMEAAPSQLAACIDGMVSYHFVNFNSAQKTKEMCQTLEPSHRALCQQSLARRGG